MEANMQQLGCGNCGSYKFTVYSNKSLDGFQAELRIEITCTQCGSSTILKPHAPAITYEWGKHSDGVLCHI